MAGAPRHGYAIMQEVEHMTRGRTRLGAGTLYRSIQRMLVDGLIAEIEDRPTSNEDDERRRYYVLSRFGRAALKQESKHLHDLVRPTQFDANQTVEFERVPSKP